MRRLIGILAIALISTLGMAQSVGGGKSVSGGKSVIGGGTIAAGGSDPASIFTTSLKRWYRADATVCGGTACAGGNLIDTFTDKAANGDATYVGGSNGGQVAFQPNIINSQPAAFQSSSFAQYTIGGTAYTPSSFTAFVVMELSDTTANHAVFGSSVGTGGPELRFTSSSSKMELIEDGIASIGTSASTFTSGSFVKIAITYNSSTGAYAFYVNSDTVDSSGTNVQTFSNPLGILFQRLNGSDTFAGYIADIVIVDGVANSSQITQMMGSTGYFHTRYGL